MSGIAHPELSYEVTHFSQVFPVVAGACGRRGPATNRWGFVTCLDCLATAPDDPRIRRRIEEVRARLAATEG